MENVNEIWKPIIGFPDYEISSIGNVKSKKNYKKKAGDLIQLAVSKKGYHRVSLHSGGKRKALQVHALVLIHFGPPQPEGTTCDHINRIKTDNRIENLRWATPQEQEQNSVKARQIGESNGASVLTEVKVREIKRKFLDGISSRKLAQEYGVSKTNILYICSGRNWGHVEI